MSKRLHRVYANVFTVGHFGWLFMALIVGALIGVTGGSIASLIINLSIPTAIVTGMGVFGGVWLLVTLHLAQLEFRSNEPLPTRPNNVTSLAHHRRQKFANRGSRTYPPTAA